MDLFEININKIVDEKYTKKVNSPQYLPSHIKPNILELYNDSKTNKLINEIKNSNVPENEKKFLINEEGI